MAGSCSPVFDRAIGPAASAIPVAGKAAAARTPAWRVAGAAGAGWDDQSGV